MTFIRVKKRKKGDGAECEFAYLVENSWNSERRQAKQKVKQYLGKVTRNEKTSVEFFEHVKTTNKEEYLQRPFSTIIKDLIDWELAQHNLKGLAVDFVASEIRDQSGTDTKVIAMNEGFLCNYTLRRLQELSQPKPDDDYGERVPGLELAKALVAAGIQVPKEVFVALYEHGPRTKNE
ncbi:MAG: hypothetical protein V1837_03175 [Candidatus Woesearchaeota archaeon]